MKLLLVGNPNAGKSTLFNLLARGHARVGNWHGVTVGLTEGRGRHALKGDTVCDLPGIYSMESLSMEEAFTRDTLRAERDAAVLFVSEYATLERSLPLLQTLQREGRVCVLLLTKERMFARAGGALDVPALSSRLNIPVIRTDGKRAKALSREIVQAMGRAEKSANGVKISAAASTKISANCGDGVLNSIYTPQRDGLSRADKLLLNGFVSIPLFFAFLALAFFVTFAKGMPGDIMKGLIEAFFSETLSARFQNFPPVARSFFQDGLCASLGSVLCFLPQIALLFLFLTLLDESGFLSRLAVLTDGFFARLGLNGRAVFSLVMGFGCTAAAVLTTRGLDDKAVQRRTILCLPYIPCSAKLPVFLTLSASFFPEPFLAVLLLYVLGVGISVAAAMLLKRGTPPFLMELAPLRVPRPVFVLKALCFQIKQFIIKVATVILAFFLLSWLLSSFDFAFRLCDAESSMLAGICGGLKWLFAPVGMADWRIAYAALSGLVAKENIAGALAMFYGGFPYGAASAFAFAVFVLTCSPCVSSISATAHEVGWRRALLYAAVQTVTALLLCYAAYFCLNCYALALPLGALAIAILFIVRKNHETLFDFRRRHPEKLHR